MGHTPLQFLLRTVTLYGAPTMLLFIAQHAQYRVPYGVSHILSHDTPFTFSGLFSAGILSGIAVNNKEKR
jgi:hypothetical protein